MKSAFLFLMKEECKMFRVNLIMWSIVAQESTNILFFYIFEYGAESGAKQYFIHNVLPQPPKSTYRINLSKGCDNDTKYGG